MSRFTDFLARFWLGCSWPTASLYGYSMFIESIVWYEWLGDQGKQEVDERVREWAVIMYNRDVSQLTGHQLSIVRAVVRELFYKKSNNAPKHHRLPPEKNVLALCPPRDAWPS